MCTTHTHVELDDDLLDLLSDGDTEDPAPKKRTKPRIQLRTGRAKPEGGAAVDASQGLQSDGKPITSGERKTENRADGSPSMDGGGGATASEMDSVPDRPRTRHSRPVTGDTTGGSEPESRTVATGASEGAGGDSKPNLPKQDSSLRRSVPSRKPRGSVDVDLDGDDLLSGMGLEDEEPALTRSSAGGINGAPGVRRGSKLDELLGTAPKKPSPKTEKLGARGDKTKAAGPTATSGLSTSSSTGEEDGYQFGGYVPSVASGAAGKPTSLPSGMRRRLGSDGDPLSLTSRPTSAPAKKSVRFADTVETSDRPSSSPSVSEVAKAPLKGSRKPSGPKEGEGGSRKPPLSRKSEAAKEAKKLAEESGVGSKLTSEATGEDDSQSDLKPRSGEELIGAGGDRYDL